jgi:drug/metabolite transporter (DMT)-like permease
MPETDSLPPSEMPAGPPIRTARWLGLLLAFGGAAGQSGGMILAKLGMANFDPLGATFVRAVGGLGGFIPLVLLTGASGRVIRGLSDGRAMLRMSMGAVAGPVLGVSAVLLAMRYSPAGVVSAITAIVPVTIILPSMIFLKEKVKVREVLGALIAVSGVIYLIFT